VAITLAGNTATLFVNGMPVATNSGMTIHPAALGDTTRNWLGDSQYSADPNFLGLIDDFRIYSAALPEQQVRQLVRPAIIIPAAAPTNPVVGSSTSLSVLAADLTAGESALTYTWASAGSPPAPVAFSANSSNAAKNTIATFTQPGAYTFEVTILNPATGLATSSTALVTVSLLPGDYNNNAAVDAADYVLWRKDVGSASLINRGSGVTGPVGPADYDFWRSHLGATTLGSGAATPETAAAPTVNVAAMQNALASNPPLSANFLASTDQSVAVRQAVEYAALQARCTLQRAPLRVRQRPVRISSEIPSADVELLIALDRFRDNAGQDNSKDESCWHDADQPISGKRNYTVDSSLAEAIATDRLRGDQDLLSNE
jgi:hypothetical protein